MLTSVSAVWDTEAKVKVKALQQVIAEIVPLDHAEVVQRPVSNSEFHPDWIQKERRETEMCLAEGDNGAIIVIVCV